MYFFFLVLVVVVGHVSCDSYSTKYDDIDIDEILGSDRLLNNYFNCIMGRGPCAPDADELKKVLPDALQTACEKCNPKQREVTKKIIDFLMRQKPKMWAEFLVKYDPDNIYLAKFKMELGI